MIKQHIYQLYQVYIINIEFILPESLNNSLLYPDILLFSKVINIVSILYYTFIKPIKLICTFLVISFAWYKEYMIWWISFNNFSDVLPACTCASATGSLWSIRLGLNILSPFTCVDLNGNIPLLKVLTVNSRPS